MSYASNSQGDCRREIEYFSSPVLDYRGTPTGDAGVRDNRRVLNETAYRLANYRQSVARSHTLPFVTSASNVGQPGFVRVINRTDRGGSVRIVAIDDTGRRFGPVNMWLPGRHTRHFSSKELEQGVNRQLTGLSGGIGDGAGNWRLELATKLDIEPLAYIRRADGFVTSMHEVAAETRAGSRRRYRVPLFNPASDRRNVSRLRLINPGRVNANIVITGVDDQGKAQPGGVVRLTMMPGTARMLTAQQLEQGDSTARMLTEQQLIWPVRGRVGEVAVVGLLQPSDPGHEPVARVRRAISPTSPSDRQSPPMEDRNLLPSRPPPPPPSYYGAYSFDLFDGCRGYAWEIAVNKPSEQEALNLARRSCRNSGGAACECEQYSGSFRQCAALYYGENATHCGIGATRGSTWSAAESAALAACSREGLTDCSIASGNSGQRASACSSQSSSQSNGAAEASRSQMKLQGVTDCMKVGPPLSTQGPLANMDPHL